MVENARVKEARKQEAEARALEERQRQEELLTWWRLLCEKVTRWRAAIVTDSVIGGKSRAKAPPNLPVDVEATG